MTYNRMLLNKIALQISLEQHLEESVVYDFLNEVY